MELPEPGRQRDERVLAHGDRGDLKLVGALGHVGLVDPSIDGRWVIRLRRRARLRGRLERLEQRAEAHIPWRTCRRPRTPRHRGGVLRRRRHRVGA